MGENWWTEVYDWLFFSLNINQFDILPVTCSYTVFCLNIVCMFDTFARFCACTLVIFCNIHTYCWAVSWVCLQYCFTANTTNFFPAMCNYLTGQFTYVSRNLPHSNIKYIFLALFVILGFPYTHRINVLYIIYILFLLVLCSKCTFPLITPVLSSYWPCENPILRIPLVVHHIVALESLYSVTRCTKWIN